MQTSRGSREKPHTIIELGDLIGAAKGQFNAPVDIASSADGEVVVADSANHRIQIFDSQGGFVRTIGEFGENPGQLTRGSN